MIPNEGIVASEIEAGLSYATISGAEILPNIAIKRSLVLRQPTKPNLDGEVCKTSKSLNRCYIRLTKGKT